MNQATNFKSLCDVLKVDLHDLWIDHFGDALHRWSKSLPPLTLLSLFSGAGGLDVGFHNAGFHVQEMVEIDARFAATLQANCGDHSLFGDAVVTCTDVREYHPLADLKVDFIIGGPPCQTFSAAGRRAAGVQGTSDQRGTLFEEYVRLLKQLQPKGFLFENVYGITGADGGAAFEMICDAFADAGYTIAHRVLDTADYGVPQHRERMIIVGTQGERFLFPTPTHGPDSPGQLPHVSALHAIRDADVSEAEKRATIHGKYEGLLEQVPAGLNYSFFTEEMGHPNPVFAWRSKFSDFLYKADPECPVRTLKAQGGQYTGPFHWDNRRFSIGELKRLQTFPDSYHLEGGRQVVVHQIGNSVPPQLARMLALAVLQQVFDVSLPVTLPLLAEDAKLGFRSRKRRLTAIYRDKAKRAIEQGIGTQAKTAQSYSYRAVLTDDLELRPGEEGELQIRVVVSTDEWQLHVGSNAEKEPAFRIEIVPTAQEGWTLPVSRVTLSGSDLSPNVFTSCWKAFEHELVRLGIKTDLVQLCGYYQYPPRFHCEMQINTDEPRWQVVKRVVEGVGARAIVPDETIANLWNVSPEDVLPMARWLRTLGYEIRNQSTNPQIPSQNVLVPYAFPTFHSRSVQFRKRLA